MSNKPCLLDVVLTRTQPVARKLVDLWSRPNAARSCAMSRRGKPGYGGRARIRALRDAVQVGVADLEAGRYRSFDAPGALRRHLSSVADDVIEVYRRSKKRK